MPAANVERKIKYTRGVYEGSTRLQRRTSVPDVFIDAFKKESEVDMSKCWGSFAQILLFHDIEKPDGEVVRKGVGVSIAFPPGVSPEMGKKMLKRALDFKNPKEQSWDGVKEGKIVCLSEKSEDNTIDLSPIKRFVQAAADVMDDHPKRAHQKVQDFLAQTNERLYFAHVVESDVTRILTNPEFTGWAALNTRYEGLGRAYVVEFILEKGIAYGGDPNGEKRELRKIATDEPHALWIDEGLIAMLEDPNMHKGGDFEDTESVSNCGGIDEDEPGGCSTFFKIMEGGNIFPTDYLDAIRNAHKHLFMDPMWKAMQEEKTSACQQCGSTKKECSGHTEAVQ